MTTRPWPACAALLRRAGRPPIDAVKMGTTVGHQRPAGARRANRPCPGHHQGYADALRIGYQARPELFDRHIVKPEALYTRVVEIDERIGVEGAVLRPLDEVGGPRGSCKPRSTRASAPWRSCCCTASASPDHEARVAAIAREIGFTQVSVSHEVSPLIKLVGRGDTTVVDAYLSPILRRYVDKVARRAGVATPGCCSCSPTAA